MQKSEKLLRVNILEHNRIGGETVFLNPGCCATKEKDALSAECFQAYGGKRRRPTVAPKGALRREKLT